MATAQKFLIYFGLFCLMLGTLVFVDHSIAGITVDMLQGVLYISSGLFAFAAVMMGQKAMRRYILIFSLVYAGVFFAGIIGHNFVFLLFRVSPVENVIHLLFALSLFGLSAGEQVLARITAPAKPAG